MGSPAGRSVLLLAEVSGMLGSDLSSLQPSPGECSECQISDTMYLSGCVTLSMSSPLHFLNLENVLLARICMEMPG